MGGMSLSLIERAVAADAQAQQVVDLLLRRCDQLPATDAFRREAADILRGLDVTAKPLEV